MDSVKAWEEVTTTGQGYTPRTGHAAFLASNRVYVFGGIDEMSRQQDLFMLDLTTLRWTRCCPSGSIPSPRSGVQTAVVGDVVYFFGGYTKKNGEYYNDLYRFGIETNSFEEVKAEPPLPPPRTDHTLVTYLGALYVFAGYAWSERLNDLWVFRPDSRIWRQLNGDVSPDPRFGHTASVYHDKMLIFGGWNGHETLNDLWTFNFPTSRWSRVTTSGLMAPRYRHTSIMCGSSLFVFGGVNKDQVRYADVFELNVGLRHWMRVDTRGQGPSPRTFHRAVLYDGFMYILGGFDGMRRNDMYRLYLQDLSPEVDIESNPLAEMKPCDGNEAFMWVQIPSQGAIYSKRTGHSAVVCANSLYVFAGTDEVRRNNDLYRYDMNTKIWTQISAIGDLPKPRSGAKGVAYNGSLYFFGGYTKKDGEYFNDFYRFNISTMDWQRLVSPHVPARRADHSLVLFDSCVYLFGGYDGKTKFSDVHMYSFSTNTWEEISATGMVPMARFGHSAVGYGRSMYVFGGWDGHDTLDDLFEFTVGSGKWREIMDVSGVKPSPRYRHTAVSYGPLMFIFAGVDKAQSRFNDLYRFHIPKKEWELVRVTGQTPSPRTFHCALLQEDKMFVLGGFDGARLNDIYMVKLMGDVKSPHDGMTQWADLEEDVELDEKDLLRYYKHQVEVLQAHITDMTTRLKKTEERSICRSCCERPIDTVLLDCAHRVLCLRCAKTVRGCPTCQKEIGRVVRTFT